MMQLFLFLFVFTFSVVTPNIAKSSYEPSDPFFGYASFIDPDYIFPDYTQMTSTQKYMLSRILEHYNYRLKTENDSEKNAAKTQNDKSFRDDSEIKDPLNYKKYMEGAALFKKYAYEDALKIFLELRNNVSEINTFQKINSWVREASTYMIARCQLIMAQDKWDGYSNPLENIDLELLETARKSYVIYFNEYPNGLYASSAKNIQRKILKLSGNKDLLDEAIQSAITDVFPNGLPPQTHNQNYPEIINELKFLSNNTVDLQNHSPILIVYSWLEKQKKPTGNEIYKLEAREKDFFAYPYLFDYIRSLGLYRAEKYQELIDKLTEQEPANNLIYLSTQLLRARAYLRLNQSENALQTLTRVHSLSPENYIELEIAYIKINSQDPLWLYSKQSPLRNEKVLRSITQFGLTTQSLEKGLSDKNIAPHLRIFIIDELLRRYLLSKQFQKFSNLIAAEKGTGIFNEIEKSVKSLSGSVHDVEAYSTIGEFLNNNYITPDSLLIETFNDLRRIESFAGFYWSQEILKEISKNCMPCKDFELNNKQYNPPISFF
jgi:hypothetical protein